MDISPVAVFVGIVALALFAAMTVYGVVFAPYKAEADGIDGDALP